MAQEYPVIDPKSREIQIIFKVIFYYLNMKFYKSIEKSHASLCFQKYKIQDLRVVTGSVDRYNTANMYDETTFKFAEYSHTVANLKCLGRNNK